MVRLRDEQDREREERNFFQLERDKVNTFWDISKRQLEEARSSIRNKERELEDAEERHQVEIKVCILSMDACVSALQRGILDCIMTLVTNSITTGVQTEGEASSLRASKQHH